jgi:hypothetical protein
MESLFGSKDEMQICAFGMYETIILLLLLLLLFTTSFTIEKKGGFGLKWFEMNSSVFRVFSTSTSLGSEFTSLHR